MTIEQYEQLCQQEIKTNEKYLELFKMDLKQSGLKDKTINKHLSNVSLYINDFLLREEPLKMKEGCGFKINVFFGYFFIPKCLWSTPQTVKSTAASIKKFYKSMRDHGHVSVEDYNELCLVIKENIVMWQEECEMFNDF